MSNRTLTHRAKFLVGLALAPRALGQASADGLEEAGLRSTAQALGGHKVQDEHGCGGEGDCQN